MSIYCEGKLRTRSWDDKEGQKRYTTEIVADTFTMLGKKENNNSAPAAPSPTSNTPSESDSLNPDVGDDLPF